MIDNTQFYGIGKGSAQVDPSNASIPYLRQIVAQEQAKKQADDAAVQAQLQKLDFSKTREADMPHLLDQYNDIRNTYTLSKSANDPIAKAKLQNQLLAKQAAMQQNISLSQQAMDHEKALGALQLNPNANLVDGYGKNYGDLTNTSVFDPLYKDRANALSNPFQPKVDIVGTNKKLLDNSLLDVDNGYTNGHLPDGTKVLYSNQGQDLKPEKLLSNTIAEMHGSPQFRRYIMDNAKGETDPAKAAKMYSDALYNQNKDGYGVSQKAVHYSSPDRFQSNWNYQLAHPKQNSNSQLTPAQTLITGMQSQVPGSGEKFLSLTPKGQYGNQQPDIAFDTATGEHVFKFPAQMMPDKKAIEKNAVAKNNWSKSHAEQPFPKEKLLPETIVKTPAKTYTLNPANPDYVSQASQMAAEQNVNLTKLNQIEGIKGGHGVIKPAVNTAAPRPNLQPHKATVKPSKNNPLGLDL